MPPAHKFKRPMTSAAELPSETYTAEFIDGCATIRMYAKRIAIDLVAEDIEICLEWHLVSWLYGYQPDLLLELHGPLWVCDCIEDFIAQIRSRTQH
jgi:hypothetical protein